MRTIRILIVDDSAFMRLTLSKRLGTEPGFEIAGTAADGHEAIQQLQALRPDVITMDVEMPGMDGLSALARIMAVRPTPVIMVSNLTHEGAETTVRALTLGAVDFVGKPEQILGTQTMIRELADKIRQAAGVRFRPSPVAAPRTPATNRAKASVRPLAAGDGILMIGSSTGGPGALRQVLGALPGDLDAAGVIVQHMPAGFTASLANRLDEVSAWRVREASHGDSLLKGQVLVAPGDYHLTFGPRGEVALTQDPPVNNVRPAVDVTMRSLARIYGGRILGVVLTGMGHDGRDGAVAIRRAGGEIIAEAESSCIVYGMPRSVAEAGAATCVVPLADIPAAIARMLRGRKGG